MTERAAPSFAALFGRRPAATASAPGRVNLIGEHTDTSGGYVLPTPIPQRAQVELAARDDRLVRVATMDLGVAGDIATYELAGEQRRASWLDYVQGVTWVLARDGHRLRGFEARIASQVPAGAGVSSSAALEVALLRGLRELFSLALDDLALARAGQRVENDFVGVPVGIMDQMAASLGELGSALFIDTRSLACERIPIPAGVELLVVDSGVEHAHAGGEYRQRRRQCEEAAARLGVVELRDLEGREEAVETLPEPLRRRARHVVRENRRVLAAADALRRGHAARLGDLLREGHASLRDDFQVSIPEIDLLAALAEAEPEVYGARLTGGGFGGCVVVLCRAGTAREVGDRVFAQYRERSGREGAVLVPPSAETVAPQPAPAGLRSASVAPVHWQRWARP
jgi:galactokinase